MNYSWNENIRKQQFASEVAELRIFVRMLTKKRKTIYILFIFLSYYDFGKNTYMSECEMCKSARESL